MQAYLCWEYGARVHHHLSGPVYTREALIVAANWRDAALQYASMLGRYPIRVCVEVTEQSVIVVLHEERACT